ncbi:unnamed protein product, partial [Cladocopium goreaui]
GPAAAWGTCGEKEPQVEACQESATLQGEEVTISLPGDAFSFAEAVDTPEDVLSELRSASDDFEDVVVEELDGDAGDDEDEDRALETEAEDNVDEGDDLDFAKDSDSDQPGATQEDVGQCDEAVELPSGAETGVEELLLMDGTEQVIIVKKKKKKRKKKRKKRQKVIEEVT